MVFNDVGSKVQINDRFMKCCMKEGVWISDEGLIPDHEIDIIRDELCHGMERRGARELRWFGANWKGHGSLVQTDEMPTKTQHIVDKMCKKIGFPKITVSTLHKYDKHKAKAGTSNQIGEHQGRKIAIVPHTDDKLLYGNGGVVMLQLNGSADVVMSMRGESRSSDVLSVVHRPKGALLVCEGDAFLSPYQHCVLWPESTSDRYMYTLTMRSLALPWSQPLKSELPKSGPPKIFQRITETNPTTSSIISHRVKEKQRYSSSPDRDDYHVKRPNRPVRREPPNIFETRESDRRPPPLRFDNDDHRNRRGSPPRREFQKREPQQQFERQFRGRDDRSCEGFKSPRDTKDVESDPPKEVPDFGYSRLDIDEVKLIYSKMKSELNNFREEFYESNKTYPRTSELSPSKLILFQKCQELHRLTSKARREKRERKHRKKNAQRGSSVGSYSRSQSRERKQKREKHSKKEKKHKKEKRDKKEKRRNHSRGRTRSYSSGYVSR